MQFPVSLSSLVTQCQFIWVGSAPSEKKAHFPVPLAARWGSVSMFWSMRCKWKYYVGLLEEYWFCPEVLLHSFSWCLKSRQGNNSFSSYLGLWGDKAFIRWWWRKKELWSLLIVELLYQPWTAYAWLIWKINRLLSCWSFPYQQTSMILTVITAYAYIVLCQR